MNAKDPKSRGARPADARADRSLYLNAVAQLEEILRDPDALTEQKRDALDVMDELDRKFLTDATESLRKRTEQLHSFITLLTELVTSLEDRKQPLEAIEHLREIIDEANAIAKEMTE